MMGFMNSRIQAAHVIFEDLPFPPVRGGAIELIIQALNQQANQIEWKVFSSGQLLSLAEKKKFKKNSNYHYFEMSRSKRLQWAFRKLIPEWAVYPAWIAEKLRQKKVDVILVHNEILYLPYLLKLKKKQPNLKVFIYFHNDKVHEYPRPRQLSKIFKQVDGVIAVSHYLLKQFKKKIHDFPRACMTCIHNASHLPVRQFGQVNKKQMKKKYGLDPSKKVILFVGRLTQDKGAYLFLEMLKFFEGSPHQFVMVGGSHHGKKFMESQFLKCKESLPDSVKKSLKLTGFVSPEKTRDYYDLADLLVFPSIWQEPSGLVLFEAWARGLPVLATRVGGVPELIKADKQAELISVPVTGLKLAGQVKKLLKNSAKLKKFSQNGIKFIRRYGHFKRAAQELEAIISNHR